MDSEATTAPRSVALILVTAALQGVVLWWLADCYDRGVWPSNTPIWYGILGSLALFLPPVLYALSEWIRQPRSWLVLGAVAVLLIVFGLYLGLGVDPKPPYSDMDIGLPARGLFSDAPVYLLVLFILIFHALPFAQNYLASGRALPAYDQLFYFAWRNALLLGLSGLFFLVTLLLLWVWAQLFKMLGFEFFEIVFFRAGSPFFYIAAVVFGTGYLLSGSANRLLLAVRNQVLSLLKWLALLATVILVSFTVTLAIRTPVLFAAHERVISATWLLWLTILMIYLYNAAFQDGSVAEPYPKRVAQLLRAAMPLLAFVAALAVYAIAIRTSAYSLTMSRFWALVVALFALAYALGYTWAARRGAPWMADMAGVNTLLAAALVLVLALTLTPLLSPERLVANSQYRRILQDPVKADSEVSNYVTLRFRSGRYGRERLKELAQLAGHPQQEMIRAAAKRALAQTDPWYAGRKTRELQLEAFPQGTAIDAALRTEMTSRTFIESDCTSKNPCGVLFQDLDGDGVAEAVLFSTYHLSVYRKSGANWESAGNVTESRTCGCSSEEMLALLRKGDIRTLTPRWQRLQVGDRVFTFSGEDAPTVSRNHRID